MWTNYRIPNLTPLNQVISIRNYQAQFLNFPYTTKNSMENYLTTKSSNPIIKVSNFKRIQNKEFKLPIQESIKIIDEVRKIEKHSKIIKPDENRKQYQQLLQWVVVKLLAIKESVLSQNHDPNSIKKQNSQPQTLQDEIQIQQRITIQGMMQQMIEMFKRQCKQKAQLMQVCFSYYTQLINSYTRHYQNQLSQTFKIYNITLSQMQDQYEDKLTQCQKKLSFFQGQKETKWKNIYMLAKDNRILRRQKGKLLRTIQQQDEKIKILEEELCQVIKENETNKLIIRFQNDSHNLEIFMKNRIAIMKFEKIIEKYPKKAMKILNDDLLKLQIEELNSLDSKIDYIKRVIIESGDIFDEFEDLNELMTKPNNMVFNMYSQTNSEDIESPKEMKEIATSSNFQLITTKFNHSKQIYDVKVVGFPELKDKYVCIRTLNRNFPNKACNKIYSNEKKDYFLMQICSRQVYEKVKLKNYKKSNKFVISSITGVNYNPGLKRKSKLNFVSTFNSGNALNKEDDLDEYDFNSLLIRNTLPAQIENQIIISSAPSRSNQIPNQGKYAVKNHNSGKMNKMILSGDKRSYGGLRIENYTEQSQNIKKIDQKSEIVQQVKQESVDDGNIKIQDQVLNKQKLLKFNKTKRLSRKIAEIPPLGLENNTSLSNNSFVLDRNFSEAKQRLSVDTNKEIRKVTRQITNQRLNTQGSISRKSNENVLMPKMNRVKTTQNLNISKVPPQQSIDMDFIQQDQQQNDNLQGFNWQKSKQADISLENTKNSSNTTSNLRNLKNNDKINEFSRTTDEIGKKSSMTQVQNKLQVNKNLSKLSVTNCNFNPVKLKNQQSDMCSINSFTQTQNESSFNFRTLKTQLKSNTQCEALQNESFNPILIKPFELKKLVEKIIKCIYIRRKQLLSNTGSPCLRNFIEHFLKQLYGNNWKGDKNLLRYLFTIDDRQSSLKIKSFSLMMNTNVHVEYLEDLFRLYVTMLDKNEFSGTDDPSVVSKAKGLSILKYLLSIYFDEATTNEIQQNLPLIHQFQMGLNEIFIVVETQLRKYSSGTQIYNFLSKLLPQNQSNIQFMQIKQLLYLFKNQHQYHTHIARLKYFFKTYGKVVANQKNSLFNKLQNNKTGKNLKPSPKGNSLLSKSLQKQPLKLQQKCQIQILPLHRVCLYLKRYQWKDVLEINTYIEQKYQKVVGMFIEQEAIKFINRYRIIIAERENSNKTCQNGLILISVPQQKNPTHTKTVHPLSWLLQRSNQLIRNYYRYKIPLDRSFLMFVHLSIMTYELENEVNDVLNGSLSMLNVEYKRLKTKQQVDAFIKD